jgi:hypothetical protein
MKSKNAHIWKEYGWTPIDHHILDRLMKVLLPIIKDTISNKHYIQSAVDDVVMEALYQAEQLPLEDKESQKKNKWKP